MESIIVHCPLILAVADIHVVSAQQIANQQSVSGSSDDEAVARGAFLLEAFIFII